MHLTKITLTLSFKRAWNGGLNNIRIKKGNITAILLIAILGGIGLPDL